MANSPTGDIVEQAIAKADAEEAKTNNEDKKQDDSKAKDAGTDKSAASKDDGKSTDKATDKPQHDKGADADKDAKDAAAKDKTDEGKYTADDALEVDEAPAPAQAPTDAQGVQLSPSEQKYIADNIGQPIVIRGIRGEGDNAKEVEIKAYSPNDIPADFKFATDQQRMAAQTGFYNLENRATQLLGNYRNTQNQSAAQDFERRENESIRLDVADLQNEGRFPKFTKRPGEKGFDDTPEAKTMAEVLQVMADRNQMYLKQYEQGRAWRHIGFAEAFELWEKSNPGRQADKKADADQDKEDTARKAAAERGDSNRGMSPSNIVRPTVKPGTTTRDILARIDAEY